MALIGRGYRCRRIGVLWAPGVGCGGIFGRFAARDAHTVVLCGGGRGAFLFPKVLSAAQKLAETLDGGLLRCGEAHGDG